MGENNIADKYDEVLLSIFNNEKSIEGFLSTIFDFLSRRTDFYHIRQSPQSSTGCDPGVAEDMVIKMFRKCNPNSHIAGNDLIGHAEQHSDNMAYSIVAREVEVRAEEDITKQKVQNVEQSTTALNSAQVVNVSASSMKNKISKDLKTEVEPNTHSEDDYRPPVIPVQTNSDAYNGAETENYSWSQTIMELDVTIKLPPSIKSAKDLKVTIEPHNICIQHSSGGEVIIKDSFPHKVKALESFWSISEGRLLIHLEKHQERWWKALLSKEEPIDLSKIDCSRNLDELPEDHIAKVRELQWNQEQKMKGLPTSEELKNIEILRKAWDKEGSPFKGRTFDPNVLKSGF